ncbi:TonB-dependent receptor [Thalassomonas haliotis]|uniref:TonB-dependent receptor n=1 Tax=Thalassomonas haliotis TaxID=485448 RepID=A0ABY7VGA4_9GAMM|nr:TonB-dependent receptor [Thalassomonas haliotis]WDE12510.1 TonB-dependent receptor [Thalassomonas haliotis]
MNFSLKTSSLAIKTILLTGLISSAAAVTNVSASEGEKASAAKRSDDIEVITITNQRHSFLDKNASYAQGKVSEPDLANWLASVPGANINSNGPVTGIAQYRGLYGDRVSTTLDGHILIGAGPNAMDTPLSYSTPLIVDAMTVYRGIAPITAGMNTLGGAIDVKMRKAEISNQKNWQSFGDVQTGYRSNNDASTLSSVVNFSKGNKGFMAYGNWQQGDSFESGDNLEVSPTDFDKRQFGFDFRVAGDNSDIGLGYHYTDTNDSGTPALAMDIEYIYSHRLSLDGSLLLGQWQGKWQLGYLDAEHAMSNFHMRPNDNPERYRRNVAIGETWDFKFTLDRSFDFGEITLGLDGYLAEHDSVISNPENAMFALVNFNAVTDDRIGLFAQWQQKFKQTQVQLGMRVKRARSDAGEVASSMAMMDNMMGGLAKDLRDNFNNSDRDTSKTNVDIALNIESQLTDTWSLYAGLGLKNRAPSYQELYLWMPLEATGGLADGNTYIGDMGLDSEQAYQLDLGLTYQSKKAMVSPHIFYQRIDDYIQGTALGMDDMSAAMMAQMMSGDDNPLQFSNVDAKLYGMDVNWSYKLNDAFSLSGIASYVRGERRDIDDDLYRIAPLNTQINVSYQSDALLATLNWQLVTKQDKVSLTNDEQESAGYGLLNLDVQYYLGSSLTLRGGIDNILDKDYDNHLGGYNRVKNADIAVMDRLRGEGASAWAELTYSF